MTLFSGFERGVICRDGVDIAFVARGQGVPVMMLHGFPQTHAMWANIAPLIARGYRVICPDLRGYGASGKPPSIIDYSFREMAADVVALSRHMGFDRFHLVGHDRGARVAHRLCLDHTETVLSVTLMDIIPTHALLDDLSMQVAQAYYHWFFLAQPEPMPERMIGADPDAYYLSCLLGWGNAGASGFDQQQMAAYQTAWRDPDCIRGMCNDYRAGLAVDFHDDAADLGRILEIPACVMWGRDGVMGQLCDVPATWVDRFANLTPCSMAGGHFFPDHHPELVAEKILGFLAQN